MKRLVTEIVNCLELAYWAEIKTDYPSCVYYFGPFLTREEANSAQNGYLEDLEAEKAQGIAVTIKRCKPKQLTIFDEVNDGLEFKPVPIFGNS